MNNCLGLATNYVALIKKKLKTENAPLTLQFTRKDYVICKLNLENQAYFS